jgi:outer membrane protein assembly factor BamB
MNGSARPVMGNGLLYLTSGHNKKLLAVAPTGSGMLPPAAVKWQSNKSVPSRPSLLLDGELLYTVSDDGFASCYEAATGKVLWNERLGDEFSASPVLANGFLYFCNQNGRTSVVAAGRKFSLEAVNRLDGGFMASPAVAGDNLILRTKTHLYAVGKK